MMLSISDKDRGNLLAVLDSIEKISGYIEGIRNGDELNTNTMVFDAVLMNFVNIGEMAIRISDELKDSTREIPWKEIVGLRNIIAHDYLGIDAEEIWQIIQDDLIPFAKVIEKLLKP